MNPEITALLLIDDGEFPNNPNLPLLLYQQALPAHIPDMASTFEDTFHHNNWGGSWRNGVYSFHHYHSTAHEVLGIASGKATVQFGGPNGVVIEAKVGDMIIVPAGVAHKLLDSANLLVIGAYPEGQSPDLCYGKAGEQTDVDFAISKVPLPSHDPLTGRQCSLFQFWDPE